jgi:hypothetical protein
VVASTAGFIVAQGEASRLHPEKVIIPGIRRASRNVNLTLSRVMTKLYPGGSLEGNRTLALQIDERQMTTRTYEITFAGEAVPAIIDAFEDFDVDVGTGRTTLRAQQFDQAALHGALDRLRALGLELLEVRVVN